MSKGSKRPGWKTTRNRYTAIGRDLAALAGVTPAPKAEQKARAIRPPATPKPGRAPLQMTERERVVREWYLYSDANTEPPAGLTEEELMDVRRRFCR